MAKSALTFVEGQSMAEPIPDEALIVRGGRNLPEDLRRGIQTHPSGVTGASVECREGMSVAELAAAIPHGQLGTTTVGAVRAAGGDVVRTSGRSPHHATLIGLSPDEASRLLTPVIPQSRQEAVTKGESPWSGQESMRTSTMRMRKAGCA